MAEGSSSQKYIFPQTVPYQSPPPPPPLMVGGNSINSNNNSLEENLKLSVEEELSYHHLNMENSNNNNNLVVPFEESPWDSNIQEPQDMGFANHHEQQQQQQPHDQQFQQTEAHNCTQSYNSSSIPDPSYLSPDLLNLLHFPRCSASSLHTNPSLYITNPIQEIPNFQHSVGFLGDLPIGSDNTSASTVLYDPLFHLNMPSHSPALRELFQSLAHGYTLPTSSRNIGSLFGGGDDMEGNGGVYQEGDGSQLDIGVLEFNRVTASVAKGKEGKDTKHFATEKQRRDQWNGKYKILRSLIPNPTKTDRASVVGDAIEYIRELIRTANELKLLVEKKRYGRDRCKRHKTEDEASESCNIKPFGDQDGCIRTSWLQRKSKDSEVDVRIIDDQVTIKLVQRKKINCLLFVSKVLDELQLDLHHVAGGHVGEYCSFLLNSKIIEGSSVYASAIANKVIEVMDNQYAAALTHTSRY